MFRARRSSTGTADELSGFAGWASTPGGPSFRPCPALCRVTPEGKVGAGEAALFLQVLGSGAAATDKRKPLGVADGLNGEIDVQFWPAEVVWRRPFNVQNFSDCGTPEPRELSETVVPEYWGVGRFGQFPSFATTTTTPQNFLTSWRGAWFCFGVSASRAIHSSGAEQRARLALN